MSIASLTKKKAKRVIGIDASTNSLAYAIFDDGKAVACGEVMFNGSNVYERLNDARLKTQILVDQGILVGDYVAMESAVMVNNRAVVIKLAYVYGAILGVLMQNKMQVETVTPLQWQSYIGNPALKKAEKEKIAHDNPGKTATWYKAQWRETRKQRTLVFARQFFTIATGSDNVGDAVGIAYFCSRVLTQA